MFAALPGGLVEMRPQNMGAIAAGASAIIDLDDPAWRRYVPSTARIEEALVRNGSNAELRSMDLQGDPPIAPGESPTLALGGTRRCRLSAPSVAVLTREVWVTLRLSGVRRAADGRLEVA